MRVALFGGETADTEEGLYNIVSPRQSYTAPVARLGKAPSEAKTKTYPSYRAPFFALRVRTWGWIWN